MISLELAGAEDFSECIRILKEGKQFQREQGFIQWDDDYPSEDLLKGDIESRKGYAVKVNDEIAGYMYVDFNGDSAYDVIRGKWRLDEPYMVVHRMAYDSRFRGQGLSTKVFAMLDDLCREYDFHYIRVDTHPENKRMQHIFEKNGYVRCGVIYFQGSDKIAYDKIL